MAMGARFPQGRKLVGYDASRQRGVVTVEFALIAIVFFALLLAIMEFGRILFAFNSAVEATRFGARIAVVCDPNSKPMIVSKMQAIMPYLTTAQITVDYLPINCDVNTCRQVQVGVTGINYRPLIPVASLNISMPPFTTTLPRESMRSTIGADANPECS